MAKKIAYLTLIFLFFLFSCNSEKKIKPRIIVAKINNHPIYERDFINYYGETDIKNFSPELKRKLLINMLLDKIIEKEIGDITIPDTVMQKIKSSFSDEKLQNILKKIYLLKNYLNKKAELNINITDEELKNYYNQHINEYFKRKALLVYQLFFHDQKTAKKIYEEVKKNPETFSKYAKIYNNIPYSKNGGCLGWIEYGDLPQDLEEAIYKLRFNKISKPIKTQYGYHIFWIKKRRKAKYISFDNVKNEIRKKLLEEKINEEYETLVNNSFKLNNIVINEKYLYR